MITIAIYASMTLGNTSPLDLEKRDRSYGYLQISYHYVITRDGKVHEGRPLSRNSPLDGDITICLVGGVDRSGAPQDNYTDEQKTALVGLVTRLQKSADTHVVSRTVTIQQELLDSLYNQ